MRAENNVRTNSAALELWASAEICGSLGWQRAELKRARDERGFPEPLAVVAGGKIAVWDARDVRAWWLETGDVKRTQKWRRQEAIAMYRRCGVIAEVARELGCKPMSVRRWLRAAGEKLPSERDSALQNP